MGRYTFHLQFWCLEIIGAIIWVNTEAALTNYVIMKLTRINPTEANYPPMWSKRRGWQTTCFVHNDEALWDLNRQAQSDLGKFRILKAQAVDVELSDRSEYRQAARQTGDKKPANPCGTSHNLLVSASWAPSQYKDLLSRYGDPHVKDKMVARLSYI